MLEDLLSAAILVFNWQTLIAISLGTIVGLMIGAIPGLSATMGMALLSPFTFFVDPLVGIPFLIGLFKGGTFGGSVSAILIGTPGTAANAATLLDGYEMRKKGKAGDAILGALHASLVGDFFGSCLNFWCAGSSSNCYKIWSIGILFLNIVFPNYDLLCVRAFSSKRSVGSYYGIIICINWNRPIGWHA